VEKELQTLADKADEGFIVFTLGSAIPVSTMPDNLVTMFVKVFARIPQQVFWKWEKSDSLMERLSDNVKILNWLPQQDLLGKMSCRYYKKCVFFTNETSLVGHKNARLYISHGGLIGIQETVYHGVPILGIPFGNDQRGYSVVNSYFKNKNFSLMISFPFSYIHNGYI
jgi:glucuronosyltransferase